MKYIKGFKNNDPHDYFKIKPDGYNLSIQYERERKDGTAKEKAKDAAKKKLEDKMENKPKAGADLAPEGED
jgi:hypothetical protein